MNPLWTYQDYVDHLAHSNYLVRRWAFQAINNRFPCVYTPEVAQLIGDADEHLACVAPKYLASHSAIDQAPAILENFFKGKGNVPSNCALALGEMGYEPAVDSILERLTHCESTETLLGILYYLGNIRREDCHRVLRDALNQLSKRYFWDVAAECLLMHRDPEDIPLILTAYFDNRDQELENDHYLRRLMSSAGAAGMFDDLTEHSSQELLKNPRKALDEMLDQHPMGNPKASVVNEIIRLIDLGSYQDIATSLAFDARGIVGSRYPGGQYPEHLHEIFESDTLALALLEELSKHSGQWKSAKKLANCTRNLVSAVLACYFSIQERGGYLRALDPSATLDDMVDPLKATGQEFPKTLRDRLVRLAPVEQLSSALTEELNTWGDIWTVRLMGQIGSADFAPDLIRVVRKTDGLSYINQDATKALNGIEESAHDKVLSAIQNGELTDAWDIFPLLEHLPYSESFDLAERLWNEGDMDSSEIYAATLEGIGDVRGIEALQEIFFEGNALFIGDSLEVLSVLHSKAIPELPIIHQKREEDRERRKRRRSELANLVAKAGQRGGPAASTVDRTSPVTIIRQSPKIGRNAPCHCGSGKKYKKCCIDK